MPGPRIYAPLVNPPSPVRETTAFVNCCACEIAARSPRMVSDPMGRDRLSKRSGEWVAKGKPLRPDPAQIVIPNFYRMMSEPIGRDRLSKRSGEWVANGKPLRPVPAQINRPDASEMPLPLAAAMQDREAHPAWPSGKCVPALVSATMGITIGTMRLHKNEPQRGSVLRNS